MRSALATIAAGGLPADPYYKETVLLLSGDGNEGGQNNIFTDSSSYSTVAPAAVSNSYATYFDGTGDYLSVASNSAFAFGTGDLTIEGWFNFSDGSTSVVRPMYSNYNVAWTTDCIYFGKHNTYAGRVSFWIRNYNASAALLIDPGLPPNNQWIHYAVTRNGNTWTLWRDGISVSTGTYSGDPGATRTIVNVGKTDVSNYLLGYVSNFRIVKGTAVYTSNFTPPRSSPLTAISGTQLLTCQNDTFIDNSSNNFTVTANGNAVNVNGFGTPAGVGSYACYFDGVSDRILIDNTTQLDLPGDFTIELWWFPLSLGASVVSLFGKWGASWLVQATSTVIRLVLGPSAVYLPNDWTPRMNKWVHIAFTRSGDTVRTFIDGVQLPTTYTSSLSTATSTGPIGIGARPDDAYSEYSNGYISNARVVKGTALYTSNFTRPSNPLTPVSGTVLLACQDSYLKDNSTNNLSMYYTGSPSVELTSDMVPFSKFGNATQGSFNPFNGPWGVYLDGSGDYLTVPANTGFAFGTGDFTVECWVYINSSSSSARITNRLSGNAASGTWGFNFGPSSFSFTEVIVGDPGVTGSNLPTMTNTWLHLAACRSGTTLRLFVNGVKVGEGSNSTNFSNSTYQLAIGTAYETQLNGYISNLRIIKGSALYTSNFTPPTSALTPTNETVLLTCCDKFLKDFSSNYQTVSRVGNAAPIRFSPFKNNSPSLKETVGNSVYFNGSNYVSIANSSALVLGTGDFCFELWVYHLTSGTATSYADQNTNGFSFRKNSTDNLELSEAGVAIRLTSTPTVPIKQWTHIAVTRVSSEVRMFINGVLAGYTTDSSNFTATSALYAGREYGAAQAYMNGFLSNVRLMKGSIPSAYSTSSTTISASIFTPPTANLTAINGTSLLVFNSNTLVDLSSSNHEVSSVNTISINEQSPFANLALKSNLKITDVGSGYFDGTGDWITTPNVDAYNLSSSESFTIECWVYRNSTGKYDGIIGARTNATAEGWCLYIHTNNTFYLGSVIVGNAYADRQINTTVIPANTWTHLALVKNSTGYIGYVNGVPGTKVALTGGLDYKSSKSLIIGALGSDGGLPFQGYISNVRIVKGTAVYTGPFLPPTSPVTAISGTTLLMNFNDASITDATGKNVFETIGNARVVTTVKKSGTGSLYFDGTGDYLKAAKVIASFQGDFTYEAWIYPTSLPNASLNIIFDHRTGSGHTTGMFMYMNNTGKLAIVNATASTNAVTLNQWNHIAFVRSSGTLTYYIDGVSGGSQAFTRNNTDTTFVIGASNDTFDYRWPGYIDNVRITIGVARYTANFTPPTTLLTQ